MRAVAYFLAAIQALPLIIAATIPSTPHTCTTNAECIRKGLPIKKPRAVAAKMARRSRHGIVDRAINYPFAYTGDIQYFKVPFTGAYEVVVKGGAGGSRGSTLGGNGGVNTATYTLTQDTNYTIIVGNVGTSLSTGVGAAGGGGASWVYLTTSPTQPLMVAAAGGGATLNRNGQLLAGSAASGSTSPGSGLGGSNGAYDSMANNNGGAGGAGWTSNGSGFFNGASGGQNRNGSPVWAGGNGGNGGTSGGYGGGGGGNNYAGGAGSGYTGGTGGTGNNGGGGGLGGTSYLSTGSSSASFAASNTGVGSIVFTPVA